MGVRRTLVLAGLAAGLLSLASCYPFYMPFLPQAPVDEGPSSDTLVQLADAYAKSRPPSTLPPDTRRTAEVDPKQTETEFKAQISDDLRQHNYGALEKEAQQDRATKARFKGGLWKLMSFYEAVQAPAMGNPTEDDWQYQLSLVKAWAEAHPQSATAQIALADSYESYGGFARGGGYANTVTKEGWKLYNERYAKAASILADAAKMSDKCVGWYEAMEGIALAQGWTKTQARKLMEDTITFEPEYYHVYREYANYLLPKWYGNPGESEAFGEEISNKVGGKEGQFIYFEIASVVMCQCDSDDTHLEYLSWPKVKQGYAALGDLYGYSNLKLNRFAHMAFEARDRAAAQQAFALIGSDADLEVWRSDKKFAAAKEWALQPPGQ
jgi:hypothetical protein